MGVREGTPIAEARCSRPCAEACPERGLTCRPLLMASTAVLGPQRLRSPARAHVPWTRRVAESTRDCDLPRIALPGAVVATRFRVFRIAAILHLVTTTYKLSHEFGCHRHRCVGEWRTRHRGASTGLDVARLERVARLVKRTRQATRPGQGPLRTSCMPAGAVDRRPWMLAGGDLNSQRRASRIRRSASRCESVRTQSSVLSSRRVHRVQHAPVDAFAPTSVGLRSVAFKAYHGCPALTVACLGVNDDRPALVDGHGQKVEDHENPNDPRYGRPHLGAGRPIDQQGAHGLDHRSHGLILGETAQ